MKLHAYLTIAAALLCTSLHDEYFYMDKPYADVLIKNPIRANLTMIADKAVPADLKPFVLTSSESELLFPSEVIEFKNNGTFNYIWMTGALKTDRISGEWKVENSQLIFKFTDNKHTEAYAMNSEMRYQIENIADAAKTKLTLRGLSFPAVTNIISTSDATIIDFERISGLIAETEKK